MKKAVFYARVSSDLQRKEKTIDSQIAELKKQLKVAGHILVKEYIDDGYSGARLDRPAMNQLREDIKTDLFETIYFLNTDRIARDVTYQTIIIAEILKHKKQIIINGKDYVHNPENKFTLTVLGAVSELERAKMLERVGRGKAMKLAQGQLLGLGSNIYGYDYIRKTPDTKPEFVVNKKEAEVVRYVFNTYSKGGVGVNKIIKDLEDMKTPTKTGKRLWRTGIIKGMLKNHTYMGIRYFHKTRLVREYANPVYGIKHSSKKLIPREQAEWIGIPVPALISKELFETVQKRIEFNRKRYRNPKRTQLLSGLIRCGSCGLSFFSYCRYYKIKLKTGEERFYFRASYKCNWSHRVHMHSKNTPLTRERCHNKEINTDVMEKRIFEMIKETVLDPSKLKEYIEVLHEKRRDVQVRIQRSLRKVNKKIGALKEKKERIIELYASGSIERDDYSTKNTKYDNELHALNLERLEWAKKVPTLHDADVVDMSIRQFCHTAKMSFENCKDFESKRQFLLSYIDKVVYWNQDVTIHGLIPLQLKVDSEEEQEKIEFRIPGKITEADRFNRYAKYGTGIRTVTLPQFNGFSK